MDINCKVNAAVRGEDELEKALKSNVEFIFLLKSNILTLGELVKKIHDAGKKAFVHVDFTEGLGRDKSGLELLKRKGVDGIITTKTSLIRTSKRVGLTAIQRFFIIDSHSVDTAIDAIKISEPDIVEVMPAVIYRKLHDFAQRIDIPLIAAGLVESQDELNKALDAGAKAVATSKSELWI